MWIKEKKNCWTSSPISPITISLPLSHTLCRSTYFSLSPSLSVTIFIFCSLLPPLDRRALYLLISLSFSHLYSCPELSPFWPACKHCQSVTDKVNTSWQSSYYDYHFRECMIVFSNFRTIYECNDAVFWSLSYFAFIIDVSNSSDWNSGGWNEST